MYAIPGVSSAQSASSGATAPVGTAAPRTVAQVLAESQVESVLDELDRDLWASSPSSSASATSRRCW